MREFVVGDLQRIEQRHQRANERGIQPADLVVGFDTFASAATAHGITQQHPAQAKTPTVLLQRLRQSQSCPLLGIHAPANTRAFNPAVKGGQITLLDAEASAQCRDIQQIENFADRETAVRQLE